MATPPDLLPEPRGELVNIGLTIDRELLDWLDGVADQANRNRSETVREILRNVRDSQPKRAEA